MAAGGFHLAHAKIRSLQNPLATQSGRLTPAVGPLARIPRTVGTLATRTLFCRMPTGFEPFDQNGSKPVLTSRHRSSGVVPLVWKTTR